MKKTRKSILALLLAVMMLFSFMPATVFAAGVDDSPALTVTLTEASEGAPSDVGGGAPDIITSEQQAGGLAAPIVTAPLTERITADAKVSVQVDNWAGLENEVKNGSATDIEITGPMTATSIIMVSRSVTIHSDENGPYTITRDGAFKGSLFHVDTANGNLALQDVVLEGGVTVPASLVLVENGGTFELRSGTTLKNNESSGNGGGVCVTGKDAIFNMTGGTILGNQALLGGGVHVEGNGATFSMTGGSILGNRSVNYGGGVCVLNGASFNMSGTAQIGGAGTNEGNTANARGGGVCVEGIGTTFDMTDGSIIGNEVSLPHDAGGGGVCVLTGAFFKMSGTARIGGTGTGEGNWSVNYGGGVRVSSGAAFGMTGGSILGNTASGNGGGVCLSNGGTTFNMSDGSILGNAASGDGGGVHVDGNGTIFSMTGGSILGNTASGNGCGVSVIRDSAFNMQGGLITAQGGDTVNVLFGGAALTVSGGAVMQTDANGTAIYGCEISADQVKIADKGTVYSRGKAVAYEATGLTFPGPTGDGLVILQKGDSAPYEAGADTDLRPTPIDAMVQWDLEGGIGGIRYEKGDNKGFLPLDVKVQSVSPLPSATYTVTFISDSAIFKEVPGIKQGSAVGSGWPDGPVKSGHTFDGWFTEQNGAGTQYTNTTPINGDVTLYAKWTPDGVPHTVNIAINTPIIPQTGDTANPLSCLLLMLAALAVCVSLLLYRNCRCKKRHG
ncbi:InlB B-repeat-containing protein [[Clostridium] hylemonae]|uniref:InlB B-repeat-containing protein n=1 Tax=[Clostridium] hylemonae TaxID=89153 RepID=UPI0011064F7A|nr:InlB B-repeat-containing protein [[Clostridium] hylemonae]